MLFTNKYIRPSSLQGNHPYDLQKNCSLFNALVSVHSTHSTQLCSFLEVAIIQASQISNTTPNKDSLYSRHSET